MKPEFSKPFNLGHAKAGASYCQADGLHAEILKWDMKGAYPLLGVARRNDRSDGEVPVCWRANGAVQDSYDIEFNLVMCPLGMIDGKPVFVGDQLVHKIYGGMSDALPSWVGMDESLWQWPAPAKVYPVTQMELSDFNQVLAGRHDSIALHTAEAIANAALRHAVDNGYLVTPEEADERGAEQLERGMAAGKSMICDHRLNIVNVGVVKGSKEAIAYVANLVLDAGPEQRAKRDMAVAEAVIASVSSSVLAFGYPDCSRYLSEHFGKSLQDAIARVK